MSDVLIVGGGPAGAVCAALCARAGMRVTLLERAAFPRGKVCGDCLNPASWPILDRLGLAGSVLELPHARLSTVVFVDAKGRSLSYPLPASERGEIAIKRRHLDHLLLNAARACGAEVHEETTVTAVRQMPGGTWHVNAGDRDFPAAHLVAADGRNSTVARLLGHLPAAAKDRVGLQTHLPLPKSTSGRVVMRFLPQGYCGLADVGNGQANLCLVAHPGSIESVKEWASAHFDLAHDQPWRSITPLQRAPATPQAPGLLLVGDAARVVEPFTGEGIYYAMATGALAADCLIARDLTHYTEAHRALYRGRLWINLLARTACKHPRFASAFLSAARVWPPGLGYLTRRVAASHSGHHAPRDERSA